ncbi:MAG: hypothetical protein F8N37_19730 [Telmatospirillum sp.]|nr:hypothetical protein [Telmatospirillum sp.]
MTITPEAIAFGEAVAALWNAHRQHLENLTQRAVDDLPRSRRTLYNALKTYRRTETDLFRTTVDAGRTGTEPAISAAVPRPPIGGVTELAGR